MLVLRATIHAGTLGDVSMSDINALAHAHPGNDILEFVIESERSGMRSVRVKQTVDSWDEDLRAELEDLLGVEIEKWTA